VLTDLIGYIVLYKVALMQQRRLDHFVIT
jgi:hypothetical protein